MTTIIRFYIVALSFLVLTGCSPGNDITGNYSLVTPKDYSEFSIIEVSPEVGHTKKWSIITKKNGLPERHGFIVNKENSYYLEYNETVASPTILIPVTINDKQLEFTLNNQPLVFVKTN